jgi:hypothetical protein
MSHDIVPIHEDVLDAAAIEVFARLGEQRELASFYLAGGTGVALQLGHRRSIDLDLFTERPWSFDRIRPALSLAGRIVVDRAEPGTLVGTVGGVRVSLFHYEAPLLEEPISTRFGIPVASLIDLACMKLIAVSQRGSRKDFVDLYYLGDHGIAVRDIVMALARKYPSTEYNPVHLLRSLAYFEDAEAEPDPVMLVPYSWERVRRYALDQSQELLDGIAFEPDGG